MNSKKITISPSVMCGDLTNLESSIEAIQKEGINTLHIDIIDGAFSPSMPLGLDTVKKLRQITDMDFDVHIMSVNNEYFINEMIQIGAQSICFHCETSLHIDRHLNLIKNSGIKAGLALNPSTPLSVLDYVLPLCDVVLLMLINPGFATDKNEKQVPYAAQKVGDLSQIIQEKQVDTKIEVDGRVSLESIPALVQHGANILVAGSTSLFIAGNTIAENKLLMEKSILEGLKEAQ